MADNAFTPWLPTYADVIAKYPGFGFPGLEIDSEKFPIISGRREEIATRFYQRYASRKVNKETLARWQLRLQNRFDEVAPEFERAFRLYERYREQMEDDMLDGYKMRTERLDVNGGTDKITDDNKNKHIDTPDSALNDDDDYADTLDKGHSEREVSYGQTLGSGGNTEYTRTGSMIIENLNKSINDYRDIDTELIKAFENNFLNIFWS